MRSPDGAQLYPHPARLILILSLAPTVGLGIGRFAYALVLPDMRDTLSGPIPRPDYEHHQRGRLSRGRPARLTHDPAFWTGQLGAMGNAGLRAVAGAVRPVRQFLRAEFRPASGRCRRGGRICRRRRTRRNDRAVAARTGELPAQPVLCRTRVGILASGLVAPFVLQGFGPGSWWIVWWAMTLLAVIMTVPVLLAPLHAGAMPLTERQRPNSRWRRS